MIFGKGWLNDKGTVDKQIVFRIVATAQPLENVSAKNIIQLYVGNSRR